MSPDRHISACAEHAANNQAAYLRSPFSKPEDRKTHFMSDLVINLFKALDHERENDYL
jgi:hypothetical protein